MRRPILQYRRLLNGKWAESYTRHPKTSHHLANCWLVGSGRMRLGKKFGKGKKGENAYKARYFVIPVV